MIDFGFVISAFVPLVLLWIFGMNHLRAVWRIALGLGVVPPLSILYLRTKLKEPEQFKKETMKDIKTPWGLVIRYYGPRLVIISMVWFIYDVRISSIHGHRAIKLMLAFYSSHPTPSVSTAPPSSTSSSAPKTPSTNHSAGTSSSTSSTFQVRSQAL